ncbi:MAG: hypothetical protein PUB98_02270 [Clostridiales bacterium]|nr:hypothetical protein [Clostridiales bacterium]
MRIKRRYLPFFLVVLVSFAYHLLMKPMGGDDVFFSNALTTLSLPEYLFGRYEEWTSRIVLELLLVTVIRVPLLWRCLDFVLFATLPLLLAQIFGDGDERMNWCAAAAVLLYPFHDMGTAGWITTTVTHFWPLWGFFFVACLLKKMAVGKKIPVGAAIFGSLACIVVGSHEQWAVILFLVLLLYGFFLWKQKREVSNALLLSAFFLIEVVSLLVIAFCPGNAARNAVSIRDLPVYANFGFGDKLYLGLLSIERVFLANADMVFLVVVTVWTLLVYLRTNSYKKTVLSGMPLLILFGQTVVRTAYPGLSGIFVQPGQILEWSWGELSTWIPMIYLAITLASMLYALFCLLGENVSEYVSALLLLGCGFGAGAVVGFMATIYVSGERVYAALYMALLCVTLCCIGKQKNRMNALFYGTGGKLIVTALSVPVLVNVGFILLSL